MPVCTLTIKHLPEDFNFSKRKILKNLPGGEAAATTVDNSLSTWNFNDRSTRLASKSESLTIRRQGMEFKLNKVPPRWNYMVQLKISWKIHLRQSVNRIKRFLCK